MEEDQAKIGKQVGLVRILVYDMEVGNCTNGVHPYTVKEQHKELGRYKKVRLQKEMIEVRDNSHNIQLRNNLRPVRSMLTQRNLSV